MPEPEITEPTQSTSANADAAKAAPAPEAAPVDLTAQLTAAKAEAAANLERFMRAAADLENFRRRTVREKEELRLFAADGRRLQLVLECLAVVLTVADVRLVCGLAAGGARESHAEAAA
jgi:molecular chaperone GrpE (heat shock protein)